MTVSVSLLMLLTIGLREVSTVDQESVRLGVQKKVVELFSFWKSPNSPLLLDLNCELDPDFIQLLVASSLSLRVPEYIPLHPPIETIATYAKVFSVRNDQDRFNLALYCHLTSYDISVKNYRRPQFPKLVEYLFIQAKVPAHSFALLWVTVPRNFWDLSGNRMTAGFAQIYASWDNRTKELVMRTASGLARRWYSRFLAVHIKDYRAPQGFELQDLRFGSSSIQHLDIRSIRIRPQKRGQGLSGPWLAVVELHHPKESNASILVEIKHTIVSRDLTVFDWKRFSSYHSLVAVARVPSISSNEQMVSSLLRAEIWLLIVSSAFAAAVVLRYVNEEFSTTFFSLILCILFSVNLKHHAKARQFAIIVGAWVLLIQVIRYGLQGDLAAARQRLPEDRAKSIQRCEPLGVGALPEDGIGYIFEDDLKYYFLHDLAVLLKGAVICKDVKGFGPLRETLLKDVPMYTLGSIEETSPHVVPVDLETSVREGAIVLDSKSRLAPRETKLLDGKLCCFRLAQLGLTHALFHRALLSSVWKTDKKKFDSKFEEAMNLSLSVDHLHKTCTFVGSLGDSLVRCFTLEDLHPRSDSRTRTEDIDSTMRTYGVLCILCIVSILLEFLMKLVR